MHPSNKLKAALEKESGGDPEKQAEAAKKVYLSQKKILEESLIEGVSLTPEKLPYDPTNLADLLILALGKTEAEQETKP